MSDEPVSKMPEPKYARAGVDVKALAERLRANLDKVTPGPWHDYVDPMSEVTYLTDDAGNTLAMTSPMEEDPKAENANAAHIAFCSGANIRAFLTSIKETGDAR